MDKKTFITVAKIAFDMWKLFQQRKDLLIKDDIWECIAFSKNAWWQTQDYAKQENNIWYITEWLQEIKHLFNKNWYSKQEVMNLLNEPWENIELIISSLFDEDNK